MLNKLNLATLPNGVTVLADQVRGARSVSVGVWLRTGARHDAPELVGLTHLAEHMASRGSTTRTAEAIAVTADNLGGTTSAWTAHDTTGFSITVLPSQLEGTIAHLADMVCHPAYDDQALAVEKLVVSEEIRDAADSPLNLAEATLFHALWGGDTIGRPLTGMLDHVERLTRRDLVAFAEERLTGQNLVVACAGALDFYETIDLVARYFGDIPKGTRVSDPPVLPPTDGGMIRVQHPSAGNQVLLSIGLPATGLCASDSIATSLLGTILGDGPTSRLNSRAREEFGLVYQINCVYHQWRGASLLELFSSTSPENVPMLLNAISGELAKLVAAPPSAHEVERCKRRVLTEIVAGSESSSGSLILLAGGYLRYGRLVSPDELCRSINAVRPEDIHRLAAALLIPANATTVLVEGGQVSPSPAE